jgi:hypothetical protein
LSAHGQRARRGVNLQVAVAVNVVAYDYEYER